MTLRAAAIACLALGSAAGLSAQRGDLGFHLVDVTTEAGLDVTHYTGAFGEKYLPETMGAGVAVFDFDGDGWQDLLFVNGTDWPDRPARTPETARLFRNQRDGTFVDVTEGSGLDVPMYGMGVAAADYDNDGHQDVLITAVGQSRLFRGLGDGRFEEVTADAGLGGRSAFSTSALWVDYDRDGLLDLLIVNYVQWTPETDIFCSADGTTKSYCTPEAYDGATSWLFRNRGDGTFQDVTASAGLFDPTSKGLGVAMFDYDNDGWPDLFVANDTQPDKLYRNRQDGTFVEVAVEAGLAFSEEGRARAGMGADAADFDGSGLPSVVVTNFSDEMVGLYSPIGRGQYADRAPRSEVGAASRLTLGFACFFFDADLSGRLDLLVVNGHIDEGLSRVDRHAGTAQPPHLFHNRGEGRLVDVADAAGRHFALPKVGRGAAFGDLDLDGDLDVVLTTNGGPAHLYRNDLDAPHQSLRIALRGTRSNRDGIGARVDGRVGATTVTRFVRTGSSYLSQSELPLTFGLGERDTLEDVVIQWPSGRRDEVGSLAGGRYYTLTEGEGISSDRPLGGHPGSSTRE